MDATTQPASGRSPSVIAPISLAIDRAGRILFRPFDPAVWFVLGFCAWLARLGENGGGSGVRVSSDDRLRTPASGAVGWADEHVALAIALALVLAVLIVAVILVVLWVSSRGKLMFVDGVIRERAAVVEPWRRFRALGNSLFLFRLALTIVAMVVVGTLVGLLVVTLLAAGFAVGDDLGPLGIVVVVIWMAVLAAVAIALALIGLFTNDFVVPMMWLHDCGALEGWRRVLPLLSAHGGSVLLYVLIKIAIAVVLLALMLIGCCLSCCLVLIPYLGTVLLLPLHVFRRSYSLEFLGQLGGPYSRLVTTAADAVTTVVERPEPPAP